MARGTLHVPTARPWAARLGLLVAPVHSKAMPAILTTETECDAWLSAEAAEAMKLQRPLRDGQLKIVARGEREDPPPAAVPNRAEPTLL